MVNVFLVDVRDVDRRGLVDLQCAEDPELKVIGEAGSVAQAMTQIPALQPDKDVGAGPSLFDNRAAAELTAKLRGVAERTDPLSVSTNQECVLLDLLGEGLTNKQIAPECFSPRRP
jgi:DNA-binding NarL/FixJ family response regulator